MNQNELYHHGIKGMKWGVRHDKRGGGGPGLIGSVKNYRTVQKRKKTLAKARATRAANRKAAIERQELLKKGKISPKKMTDAELRQQTERLRAESTYKNELKNARTVSKGRSAVESFAKGPGKKIFFDTTVDIAAQSFKAIGVKEVNRIFNQYGFEGDVVFTNNKRK